MNLVDQGQNLIAKHRSKTHTTLSQSVNMLQSFYQRRNKNKENKFVPWIERLLKTPIPDHRKYCIWRILAPYFINVKHFSFDDSYEKIYQWLDRCNKLKELDFDPETKISDSLNRVTNTGYLPISFDNPLKEPRTLKSDNRELYNILLAVVKKNVAIKHLKKRILCFLAS
jgi:hypothetical protein